MPVAWPEDEGRPGVALDYGDAALRVVQRASATSERLEYDGMVD
jgi:hypothetical protein